MENSNSEKDIKQAEGQVEGSKDNELTEEETEDVSGGAVGPPYRARFHHASKLEIAGLNPQPLPPRNLNIKKQH